MLFRKAKLHQRCPSTQILLWRKTIPLWSWKCFKRSHFPLNSKCPQNTSLPMSPSLVQKSILCWCECFSFERCPCKKLTKHACAGLATNFASCVSCSELGGAPYSRPLHCSLPCPNLQSPSPAQTQAPTQSPRQQDCQSACGGHSCLFSESHGGGFNIFASGSGTTLIDGNFKICTKLYRSGKLSSIVTWRDRKLKKTADVGMHEERSECSLVFSINFDLCDLVPTFFSFSSVSSIYAYIGPHVFYF